MSERPLSGCRVLDLGIITAGASTTALLADLGADVIKVESSAYIDPFRAWDKGLGAENWWNRSRFFDFTNRNKRGLALDLKQARGRELFLELAATADVVLENFRRGVLERLGLGYETLAARNPRIILASITSQGEHGPDAKAASYGSTLEASSGLSDLTRDGAGAPLISGILLNYPDQIVSIYAAGVVCLAVMEQRRSGRGARLDISQRELASFLIGPHILAATAGPASPPASLGGPSPATRIVLSSDGHWLLCHGASAAALERALADVARADRSELPAATLVATLAVRDVQAVKVRNADELLRAAERGEGAGAFARTPDGGHAKGMPFALEGMPLEIARRAPRLGEHNEEILRDLLGLGPAEISALQAERIIADRPNDG